MTVVATPLRVEPDRYAAVAVSQGFRVGDLVFTAGQIATDDAGAIVGDGDFEAQAHQAFANLSRALQAGGSGLEHVVKATIFVTDMSHFATVVNLRRQYFTPPFPADSLVEVHALGRPGLLIEIEAVAVCPPGAVIAR